MSKLSVIEIEKVARLARIELSADELDKMCLEISSILDFVDTLQSTNVNNVNPTSQVTGLSDVWREDEVVKSEVAPDELLAASPDILDNYIKVKKVL